MNRKEDILSPKEALTIGNMFFDEYNQYKNYKPRELVTKNKKDELMLRIMELSLATNDLGLYLDLNPNDKDIFELFKTYMSELKHLEEIYCVEYEPLNLEDDYMEYYKWWNNWPWEGKNV